MLPFVTVMGKTVPLYAVCIITGLVCAAAGAAMLAPHMGVRRDDALYSFCYACMGLVAGGKIMYVLMNLKAVALIVRVLGIMPVLQGGFVIYGGLLGAFLGVQAYARQFREEAPPLFGLLITVTPLAQAFGRMGCLCAGCCYGREWHGALAVRLHGAERFPVQVLAAALDALLFGALLLNLLARGRRWPGNFALYLCGYGAVRLVCERFRGDAARGFAGPLSVASWMSVAFIAAGAVLLWRTHPARLARLNRKNGTDTGGIHE